MAEETVYLVGCAACSRRYVLPWPLPQRRTSDGRLMEPDPWFCRRTPCRKAEAARAERVAQQERIGSAHRKAT